MRRLLIFLAVVASACSNAGTSESTTTSTQATTTTVATTTTQPEESTTTATLPPDCPKPPYDVGVLPARAGIDRPPTSEQVLLDQFTTIPGTSATLARFVL